VEEMKRLLSKKNEPTFETADPRLVRLLPRAQLPTRDLWMVLHRDLRTNARVTSLCTWLVELFGESQA